MTNLAALSSIPELHARFRELCRLYADLVAAEGVKVLPFRSEDIAVFSALPSERQEQAIASITTEVEIFEAMLAENQSLRDSPKLLWRSMRRMGLVPMSDVFDKIGDQDTVEIYLVDETGQRQVFRNLKWLEMASYTVEQLVSMDWRIQAERDEKFVQQIAGQAIAILSGQREATYDPGIEEHEVCEVDSPELRRVRVKIKYLSPVKRDGRAVGAISIDGVEIIGRAGSA